MKRTRWRATTAEERAEFGDWVRVYIQEGLVKHIAAKPFENVQRCSRCGRVIWRGEAATFPPAASVYEDQNGIFTLWSESGGAQPPNCTPSERLVGPGEVVYVPPEAEPTTIPMFSAPLHSSPAFNRQVLERLINLHRGTAIGMLAQIMLEFLVRTEGSENRKQLVHGIDRVSRT